MIRTVVEVLILIGAASLIYWTKLIDEGSITPWRAELPFALAVLMYGLHSFANIICRKRASSWDRDAVAVVLALGAIVTFSYIATYVSLLRYDLWFDSLGLRNLTKLLFGIPLFLVTYRLLVENPSFHRRLALALVLPSVAVSAFAVVLIVAPGLHQGVTDVLGLPPLVGPGDRFVGFTGNPAQAAYNALVAAAFLLIMSLVSLEQRHYVRGTSQALLVIGMSLLIFWSQTRSAILALGAIVLFSVVGVSASLRQRLIRAVSYLVVSVLLVAVGLILLPGETKAMLMSRVTAEALFGSEGRRDVLAYYVGLMPFNPLGLGVNYEQEFVIDLPFEERQNAHSILDIWVYGGIGAVVATGVLFGVIWRRLLRILGTRGRGGLEQGGGLVYHLGSVTAFMGIWVAGIFTGSPLMDLKHPLLLAMVLAGSMHGIGTKR